MNGKLTLADLLIMADMEQADAIEYAKSRGVDLAEDYDDIAELIAKQSYEIYAYSKLQLLQLLLDVSKDSDNIQNTQKEFTKQADAKGWSKSDPQASERAAVNNGYAGYSDSQRRTEKKIEFYMYLAVLDGTTTTGCRKLNKKVFRYDDPNAIKYVYPPRHYNCRSMHLALKSYKGTVDKALSYRQYWATEPFIKIGAGYTFKPDAGDYDSSLFSAYENE